MSRFTHQITSYWQQMLSVMRNEFRSIFTDAGVVLILVLALIIYATVYSMAYGAQVLRNVPIGVVDECRTPTSRSLSDTFNAGPNTYVAYNPSPWKTRTVSSFLCPPPELPVYPVCVPVRSKLPDRTS